jgi:hypothetical protein
LRYGRAVYECGVDILTAEPHPVVGLVGGFDGDVGLERASYA